MVNALIVLAVILAAIAVFALVRRRQRAGTVAATANPASSRHYEGGSQ